MKAQILKLVKEKPGISTKEILEALKESGSTEKINFHIWDLFNQFKISYEMLDDCLWTKNAFWFLSK